MPATFIRQDNIYNITEYANTFLRQGAFPLERFSVFDSYDAAKDYAANDPRAYIGQQLVIVESANASPSSFVISGTGGALVRMADTYDLTSASDNITGKLDEHEKVAATSDIYGHVKIGTDLSLNDYSRVPNCSSVKTAINTSIQGLSGTVDSKFLPLSGGTITGNLRIEGNNNYIEQLDFGGAAANAGLKVRGISGRKYNVSEKGSLFINYDEEDVSHNEYWAYNTDDGRGVFICGSGNDSLAVRKKDLIAYSSSLSSSINSKVYNEFLPLSGGTLSGNVYYGNDKQDYSENRPDLILVQGGSTNNKSRLIFKEGGWKDQVHLFATYADIGGADDNNKFHIATAVGAQGNELNVTTTPKMTILFGSGNVGIGTETPQTKLHVNGDIKSTSLSATSGYIDDTLYIKNKIIFPESIIIGNNINTSKSGIIQIRAHNSSDESVFGYSSLLIDDSGITITHSSSDNDGSLTSSPQSVTIQANTLDKLNHIDSNVTSGSTNLIESGAVYDYLHGDTISLGLTTDTPSGTIELVAGDINGLYNKLSVTPDGLTLSHPISSLNDNNEVLYTQDEVSVTAEELKKLKNLESLKSTMVVREWNYESDLPPTSITNNTMMIFRDWNNDQNALDIIDKELETI